GALAVDRQRVVEQVEPLGLRPAALEGLLDRRHGDAHRVDQRDSHREEYRLKLLVLPGDGIGPEITAATLAVLEAADRRFNLNISCEKREIGLASLKKEG